MTLSNTSVVVAVTRVATNTGIGNQDITTTDLGGLIPKAAFFTITYATADGTPRAGAVFGFGAATSTSNRSAIVGRSEDNVPASNTSRRGTDDECIQISNPADGTVDGEADFVAFIANGVRINWGNAPASAYLMTVEFWAGTDLLAHADTFNPNTQNNTRDIVAPNFEPDIVLFWCNGRALDDGTGGGWSLAHGVSANDGSDTQRCWFSQALNTAAVASVQGHISNLYAAGQISSGGGLLWTVEIGGYDAQGFTATSRLGNPGTDDVGYLALSFGDAVDFWAGSIATPTAAAPVLQSIISPSFKPQYVHLGVTQMPLYNTDYTDGNAGSMGIACFDENSEFCSSWQDEDGADPMNTQSLSDDTAINLPNGDGSAGHVATRTALIADGWTWNFTTTEGTAVQYWAAAIEDARPPRYGFTNFQIPGIV